MKKEIIYKEKIISATFFFYLLVIFLIPNSTLYLEGKYIALLELSKSLFSILCILFMIFFNKYRIKEIVVVITVLILFFITRIIAGTSPMLDLALIVLAIKEIPLKRILKIFLTTQTISFFMIIILNLLNFIPSRLVIRDGIERHSLGFWHPNTAGLMLLSILILSLFFTQGIKKILIILIVNVINGTMFIFTNSRTSLYLIILVTIVTLLFDIFKFRQNNILNYIWIVPTITIIMFIVSIMLSLLFIQGNTLAIQISAWLSNRISIGSRFLSEYGIHLFGQQVGYNSANNLTQVVIGFEYRVLDNIYLKYLINFGIVTVASFVMYLILIAKKLNSETLFFWNAYFPIFLFLGFTEQGAFNYMVNFFMLFGVLLFQTQKNNDIIKIKESEILI